MIRTLPLSLILLGQIFFANSGIAQKAPESWESTAGTKVSGSLLGIEGDSVGLLLSDGRKINAPYSKLIGRDQARVKTKLTRLLTKSVTLDPSSPFPAMVEVPAEFATIKKGEKDNEMFVYESARCLIRSNIELPPQIATEVAVIFEGTLHLLSEVWKPLGEIDDSKYTINVFEDLDALTAGAKGASEPGYYRETGELNCIWTTVGLHQNKAGSVALAHTKTAFSQGEVVEMVFEKYKMRRATPIWIYEGLKQLCNDMKRDGKVFYPVTSLQPVAQSTGYRKTVAEKSGLIVMLNNQQWYDETDADRAGKSSSYYFKALRLTAMVAVWTCLTDEGFGGKAAFSGIFAEARKAGRPPSSKDADALNLTLTATIVKPDQLAGFAKQTIKKLVRDISFERGCLGDFLRVGIPREWKNKSGKSLTGVMIGYRDGKVALKTGNEGKVFRIALKQFSPEDQLYAAFNMGRTVEYASALAQVKPSPVSTKRKWPTKLQAPGAVTNAFLDKRLSSDTEHVYRSKNFRFTVHSRKALTESLMTDIAQIFEGTLELLSKSPIGVQASPVDGFFQAELFETELGYREGGGPLMSGGVYKRSVQKFLVPFKSLGIEFDGSQFKRNDRYRVSTLVHELTHMMMHDILSRLPIWASEGSAEYTESIPLDSARVFHCERIEEGIKSSVARYRKYVPLPVYEPGKLMVLSRSDWYREIGNDSEKQHCMYVSAKLLFYYFMTAERERMLKFLEAKRLEAPFWKLYDLEYDQYKKDVVAFKKLPGVTIKSDGRYSYRRYLDHPVKPIPPMANGDEHSEENLKILLDGRTPEELGVVVEGWLRDRGLFW